MAGWDGGINNDDDVLNLNLFARKSFGFQGIPKEKEGVLRKIVTHLGASCDDYPKYIFTSIEHYTSLTDVSSTLYNVTYIRDCVDANRCLTIEHYKFGPKYSDNKEYREFDPCCANFHNGNEACTVCDLTLITEVSKPKVTKRGTKNHLTPFHRASEISTTKVKKEKVQDPSEANQVSTNADLDLERIKKSPWEPWEDRLILDYLICNKLIFFAKGPSAYKKLIADGFLKHRTSESMRIHFRKKILPIVESFDLPPAVVKEFKKLRKIQFPARVITALQKHHTKKRKEIKKKMRPSAKES